MWNPWEWLKWFYEAPGHKHPTISACGSRSRFALRSVQQRRSGSNSAGKHRRLVAPATEIVCGAGPAAPTVELKRSCDWETLGKQGCDLINRLWRQIVFTVRALSFRGDAVNSSRERRGAEIGRASCRER